MRFLAMTVAVAGVLFGSGCRHDYNPTPPPYYCQPACGCAPAYTPPCNPCAPSATPYLQPSPTVIPRTAPYTTAPAPGTYAPPSAGVAAPSAGGYGVPAANPNATLPAAR